MTKKEAIQFNRMHAALKKIAKDYQTTGQLRLNSEKEYGLEFEESLEMSYHNIQVLAEFTIRGIRKKIIY